MYYTELKESLSIFGDWPDSPDSPNSPGYFYVINSKSQPTTIQLSDLDKALKIWLPSSPFTSLVNKKNLPGELSTLAENFLDNLKINEFGIMTGPKDGENIPINGFNFTLEVEFDKRPSVCGLALNSVGLELNFVDLGGTLTWNPILIATCEFLGVKNCGLSIGLFEPSINLMLSQTDVVSVDTILDGASSSVNLSSLTSAMGLKQSGDGTPQIQMFMVNAELSDTPIYSCILILDAEFTWKKFTLAKVAILFEYRGGGNQTVFSFAATALMGGYEVEGILTYNNETTSFTGSLATTGASLSDFLDCLAAQLNITSLLPKLPDVELSGLSITLNDTTAFEVQCGGSIAFDSLGTSLCFTFNFVRSASGELVVTLNLDTLEFKLDLSEDNTLVFSYTGPETLPFAKLVQLARIYPLYGIAHDIKITLEKGMLIFVPNTKPATGHHILCGLEFSFDATLNDKFFQMFTGSQEIGIRGATLYAANTAWALEDLRKINGLPLSINTPISSGISLSSALVIGGNSFPVSLDPPNTNNLDKMNLQPPQAITSPDSARWFKVQKQAGPVYLERIGIKLSQGTNGVEIAFMCDASLTLGPMTVALCGFSVDVSFGKPITPSVSLKGMNVSYSKSPLQISGGFLDKGGSVFIGDLTVKDETLFLSAIGEYATKTNPDTEKKYTSLAMFAALTEPPLGGPAFCFVDGLAAGFGYNSALKIPTKASQVKNFALVKAASGLNTADPFTVIEQCISPQLGENWVALGLLFRSFEFIQSTVLLTAAFGNNLQFAILGQAEMSIPPASKECLAYAQVDIEAHYVPATKSIEVSGILTPNSFVFSRDCHIQGGFVYILKETGDFIVSYGGYAPGFDYAKHGYPAVRRLGISWNIDSHTSIKGTEYFALSPAVMMAGGSLQATWNSGVFSAWFYVAVDMFMQWKPFYFKANFTMSLGVSFKLKVLFVHVHFTFHLGANLSIEGPPFRGQAHIDLDVISFDIAFGPSISTPNPLSWSEFRTILPGKPNYNSENVETSSDLLAVKVTDGLLKDSTQNGSPSSKTNPDWIVNGTHFCFNIQTSLPITKFTTGDIFLTEGMVTMTEPIKQKVSIGILPMAASSATGELSISITKISDGSGLVAQTDLKSSIVATPINKNVAPAHWATTKPSTVNADVIHCTTGYTICGRLLKPDTTAAVELENLLVEPVIIVSISSRVASMQPFN